MQLCGSRHTTPAPRRVIAAAPDWHTRLGALDTTAGLEKIRVSSAHHARSSPACRCDDRQSPPFAPLSRSATNDATHDSGAFQLIAISLVEYDWISSM